MKTLPAFLVLSLAFCACRPPASAADYQGASAVLKQAKARSGSANDPAQKPGPLQRWREDLRQYKARAATLPPDEAARAWIALFDAAPKLPSASGASFFGGPILPRLQEVLQVLPPPAVWDALEAQAAAHPTPQQGSRDFVAPVLRIVTATLQDKPTAVRQAIDALGAQIDNLEGPQRSGYQQAAQSLRETFLTLSNDKQGVLADFEAKLASLQPGVTSDPADAGLGTLRENSLEVPNLVSLVGVPRAEALLKELFTLNVYGISVNDEGTQALARKVALEMADELKFAPWDLTDSLDATALYDVLSRRFPGTSSDPLARQRADAYHVLGLIVAQRTEEAAKLAVKIGTPAPRQEVAPASLPEDALVTLTAQGYSGEVFRFLDRLLADHPELPYWSSYLSAAVTAGETDAMLARTKAASERPDLKPSARNDLRRNYGQALLAADRIPEALPILRETAVSKRLADGTNVPGDEAREIVQAAARLADLGRLLGDDALLNEQLDTLVAFAKKQPDTVGRTSLPEGESLGELFLAAGRGPDMEQVLAASLSQSERLFKESLAQRPPGLMPTDASYYSRGGLAPLLELTDLYDRAGRQADVVTLLDHAESWGVPDLAALAANGAAGERFLLQAARALQKTGHPEAALRVVNASLDHDGGSDPAYTLLLELLPPDRAEARLDELFRGDQFEERPLIWRAVLQLEQGRLDEAENSARQAISIDPSDGEEGWGDRMRAYAVLGDILERKGEAPKAAQFRQVVRAIRLSEDADRFHSLGLLTRAVAMYKEALGYFADAYCIQSRLAIQLTALGKLDEAAAHYERAYELMPESFGRLESHCFGCERAFAGQRAQGTAERVFRKLADQQPANPRVHYLLGYLWMEEDRKPDAAREFAAAVKLDPDYINAWKQLAANTDDPATRDRATLNLLRLDPRQKHDSAELDTVNDLRALWAAVEKVPAPLPPEPLYPLEASATLLQPLRERFPQKPPSPTENDDSEAPLDQSNEPLTPRTAVLRNKVIEQALQFLPGNDNAL